MPTVRAWMIFLSVAIGLVGHAEGQQRIPVTNPTQRLEFEGFSILPPQGENWFMTAGLREVQGAIVIVSFGKRLTPPSKTHTVTATVSAVRLPDSAGNRAERLQKYAQIPPSGRFRVVSVNISPDTTLAPDCVRIDATSEDRGVPGHPDSIFIMDQHSFVCFHPYFPDAAIDIQYSQRRLQEEAPLSLEAEGEPFVKSLIFTRLPGRSSP